MPLSRNPISLLAAAALLLVAGSAAADVVPPPPEDCIDGAVGNTGHVGPYCSPLSCSTDADCKDGRVCRELPACMSELTSYNRRMPESPPSKYTVVVGPCDKADGSACTRPPDSPKPMWGGADKGTCKAVKLCVKPPPTPPEPKPDPKPPEPKPKPDAGATKPTTEAGSGSGDKPKEPVGKKPAETTDKPAAPESSSGCSTALQARNAWLLAAFLLLLGLVGRRGVR